jgi:DNA-binding LacI/PurR family transcriptional regulator/anti-anti-sigma regulatory factor
MYEVFHQRGLRVIEIVGTPRDICTTGLARNRVDGWIVVQLTDGIEELALQRLPIVTVAALAPDLAFPAVLPDNRAGMQAAVEHLLDHGHTQIAFVGDARGEEVRQRYEGYQAALAERNLAPHPSAAGDSEDDIQNGRMAAQQLIDSGFKGTALVAATDETAFGAIEILQAAGYRIPEDVAIVSFDDIDLAQYSDPPLTTIQQRPDAIGRTAAQLLIDQIEGRAVPPGPAYVPTALMRRRSCGCSAAQIGPAVAPNDRSSAAWQAALAEELVRLAIAPIPLAPGTPPAQIWPGIEILVQALEATVYEAQPPTAREMQELWQWPTLRTINLETLFAMIAVLERAGNECLAAAANEAVAQPRLKLFLDSTRLEMMRARLRIEISRSRALEVSMLANQDVSVQMFLQEAGNTRQLAWLSRLLSVQSGCLGMWSNEPGSNATLVIAGAYQRAAGAAPLVGSQNAAAVFPPEALLPAPTCDGSNDIVTLLPIKTTTRDLGVLALCGSLDDDINKAMWAGLLGAALEREALVDRLMAQQATLRDAYERERSLAETIHELGSPVVPIFAGVLLVPLVGGIDTLRAQQIIEAVLSGVTSHHAHTVLLDITGVPIVDTNVANSLIQTARAATLLGARVVLVGIRPEIAQSIVGLGIDLSHLDTQPSLAVALESLQRLRKSPPLPHSMVRNRMSKA